MKPSLAHDSSWIVRQTGRHTLTASGFENGQAVPIEWPHDLETDEAEETTVTASTGLSAACLDFVNRATTTALIGERALLLSVVLKSPSAPKNSRELGDRLGCSHTAAQKRLSKFRADLLRELQDFAP